MIHVVKASSEGITATARALIRGGIVAIPTCRWFMVCCLAEARNNIELIFEAKKRPAERQPLFVVPRSSSASEYFIVGEGARRLVDKLWPGELTLILPWLDFQVASRFDAMDGSKALVYCPSGVFGEVANVVQAPLAATTLSISDGTKQCSHGPAISAVEVLGFAHEHKLNIEVVIDDGLCPAFTATTIVDCGEPLGTPRIVREGYVHRRAVEAALLYDESTYA